MRKKIRRFYEENGFHLYKLVYLGADNRCNQSQVERAMVKHYKDLKSAKQIENLTPFSRIRIGRDVLQVAKTLPPAENVECIGTEKYITMLEERTAEYKNKWIMGMIAASVSFILIILMKLFGVQGIL